jgi:hypothetical protein
LERLNALGVIAIINENDVVTGCSELDTQRVFSDNDKLSALVAAGSDADGLALRMCPFQLTCFLQLLPCPVFVFSLQTYLCSSLSYLDTFKFQILRGFFGICGLLFHNASF